MASTVTSEPAAVSTGVQPRPWLAVATLAQREWMRFVRQRNRVFGAIGQPILFWLLFGAGLEPSFRWPGGMGQQLTYREYFFPGTLILILLFTAIFTTISLIEDRREGFLQSVLVAPVPRWAMVLGKLLGGTFIALAQGLLFLALGLTLGLKFSLPMLAAIAVFLSVVSFALTGLGFIIAWRMDSTQGFHAVMSVFLMPLWLLSGAFFPAASGWLYWVIVANPLSYAVAGLRRMLYWEMPPSAISPGLPSLEICWAVTLLFAVAMFMLSWQVSGTRTTADLV